MSKFKVSQADLSDISRKYSSAVSSVSSAKIRPASVNRYLTLTKQSSLDISTIKHNISYCSNEINALYSDLIALRNGIEAVRTESEEADRNAKRVFKPFPFSSFVDKVIEMLKEIFNGKDPITTTINNITSKLKEWSDQSDNNQVEKSESEVETIVYVLNPPSYDPNEIQDIPVVDSDDVKPSDGYADVVDDKNISHGTNLKQYENNSCKQQQSDYSNYNVLPNVNSNVCYNQRYYENMNSTQGMCVAVSEVILLAIYHNQHIDPMSIWGTGGRQISNNTTTIKTKGLSNSQVLSEVYNQLANKNTPVMVRIGGDKGHSVVAIGIREGCDPNNLSYSDILVIDPSAGRDDYGQYNGTIRTLQETCDRNSYGSNINNWNLEVPT